MSKKIEEEERTRFTFRVPDSLLKKVTRRTRTTMRSVNEECIYLIGESLGFRHEDLCIVTGDSGKYWFSPIGIYGELTQAVVKRFIKGSLPLTGTRWDEVFDGYEEAMESFGDVVVRRTAGGMMIEDWKEFCAILREYDIPLE